MHLDAWKLPNNCFCYYRLFLSTFLMLLSRARNPRLYVAHAGTKLRYLTKKGHQKSGIPCSATFDRRLKVRLFCSPQCGTYSPISSSSLPITCWTLGPRNQLLTSSLVTAVGVRVSVTHPSKRCSAKSA